MTSQGTILLADDEETFLEATKDLLEEEGFDCHGVRDATELSQALTDSEFDLLITDLNMPGNRIMEQVSALREQAKTMPVIVVTGYPSVPTAVESVRLNVMEYLIKPINFPKLLDAVKRGVHHKQVLRTISQSRQDAEHHTQSLVHLEKTLRNVQLSMSEKGSQALYTDLSQTMGTPNQDQPGPEVSGASSSPSMTDYFRLRESIFHTIQVLQKTKNAFRSKDLAGLRKYLEEVLRETTETLKSSRSSSEDPHNK